MKGWIEDNGVEALAVGWRLRGLQTQRSRRTLRCAKEKQEQLQVPPLRCGMTSKKRAKTNADPLRG
jgi:hypothetical protein